MSDWKSRATKVENNWKSRAQASDNNSVVEEMPDWLPYSDRAIAKNFANSDQAQIDYLKKQHPDAEVKIENKNIYLRKKNEPWKALDPDTGFFSKDFLKDAGDIAYDTVGGAVQSTATALGGALGGIATLPSGGWGALPAAMATSGSTGGLIEAIRQYSGQQLGIPQEVDGKQVALNTAIGTVAPALFGAGNITKTPIAKNLTSKELSTLMSQQRGVFGRIADGVAPTLSSVPRDAINAYSKLGQESIDDVTSSGGLISYLDKQANEAKSALMRNKSSVGEQMNNAYAAASDVPLSNIKNQFETAIQALESQKNKNPSAWTPALEKRLLAIKNGFKETIPEADLVDATTAFDIQQSLKRLNKNFDLRKDANNYDYLNAVDNAYGAINQELDTATSSMSGELKNKYKNLMNLEEMTGNTFDDGQKLYNTLSNMDKGSKLKFKEQVVPKMNELGVDLQNPYEVTQSFKYFADPKAVPISNGTTSTTYTNTLGNLGADVGAITGNAINPSYTSTKVGSTIGGFLGNLAASPKTTKFLIDHNKKQIAPVFLNQNTVSVPFLEYMLNGKN